MNNEYANCCEKRKFWHRICVCYTVIHAVTGILAFLAGLQLDPEYMGLVAFPVLGMTLLDFLIRFINGCLKKSAENLTAKDIALLNHGQIFAASLGGAYDTALYLTQTNRNAEAMQTGITTYSRSWSAIGSILVAFPVTVFEAFCSAGMIREDGFLGILTVVLLLNYFALCCLFTVPAGKWQEYNRILLYGQDNRTPEGKKRIRTTIIITYLLLTGVIISALIFSWKI